MREFHSGALDSGFVSLTFDAMRLLCPAKINLHLRIGPVRDDGFHPLLSWFCMAGLFDTLILEQASPLPTASADPAMAPLDDAYIALFCDQLDLPCDRRNLVVKIGDAWAREALTIDGSAVFPVNAELRKRQPEDPAFMLHAHMEAGHFADEHIQQDRLDVALKVADVASLASLPARSGKV